MIASLRAAHGAALRSCASIASAGLLLTAPLAAGAVDIGVSIGIGQPGYYGQINIGEFAQPPGVIYAKPVFIERDEGYRGPPLYLRVPVGYEKHWAKHCREYRACNRPVYFVRDDWYRNTAMPHYEHRHEGRDDHGDHGGRAEQRHGSNEHEHEHHD